MPRSKCRAGGESVPGSSTLKLLSKRGGVADRNIGPRPSRESLSEEAAEIQNIATQRNLTTREAADVLRVSKDKILQFIRTGDLVAYDVSANTSKRPQYRIPATALSDFANKRRPTPERYVSPPESARIAKLPQGRRGRSFY
jgi:excisionase family DNA binding protein